MYPQASALVSGLAVEQQLPTPSIAKAEFQRLPLEDESGMM